MKISIRNIDEMDMGSVLTILYYFNDLRVRSFERAKPPTLTETREPPFLGSQWPFSKLHEFIAPSVLRYTMAVEGLKRKAATALVEADDEETVSYSLIDKLQAWMSLFVSTCFHGFGIRLNSQTTYHLS